MTLPRQTLFWAVSIGHFTIDLFNSIGPVLLAFLSGHILQMTNTQIGFAVSAYQLAGALSQPLFGYLADRSGGRWIGAGGVTWTVSMLMLSLMLSTTGEYVLMLIPFVAAALGSGAFHPVGAMHASEADKTRVASNLSVFFLMGQSGSAVGPVLVGILLDSAATHNAIFTSALGPAFSGVLAERGAVSPVLALSLLALPAVLLMLFRMPNKHHYSHASSARAAAATSAGETAAPLLIKPLLLLALVVLLRSLANPGLTAFVPRLLQLKGWSAAEYGLITSAFWLSSGIAGVIFGQLADRYSSRMVIAVTLFLSAPALFLLPTAEGAFVLVLALLTGAFTGGSHSLIVVMSQRLMPARKGFASGAILGFIFGTGAVGTLVIGTLSDQIGLLTAFQIVAGVMLLTGALALLLPRDKARVIHSSPAADSASAEPVASQA